MLFARAVQFSAKKSAIDEAIGIYQNSVIPAAGEQKGFRGAVLLTDRANARATSITFWESEADLLQSGLLQEADRLPPAEDGGRAGAERLRGQRPDRAPDAGNGRRPERSDRPEVAGDS